MPSHKTGRGYRRTQTNTDLISTQARLDQLVHVQLTSALAVSPLARMVWLINYAHALRMPGVDGHVGVVLPKLIAAGYGPQAEAPAKRVGATEAAGMEAGGTDKEAYVRQTFAFVIDLLARGEELPSREETQSWLTTLEGLPD